MHRSIAVATCCVVLALPSDATREPASQLRWLRGLVGVTIVDRSRYTGELPATDPDCMITSDPVFEAVADVVPAPGAETVLASITGGVVVLDRQGQILAALGGFACEGSADRIESLVIGRSFTAPVIAVLGTTRGEREQSRWITLIHPDPASRRLHAVFTGIVEERGAQRRDGKPDVERGWVALLPGSLLHRQPGGATAIWQYDAAARAYVPRGWIDPPDTTPQAVPVASLP
jgi:hypothetical protein